MNKKTKIGLSLMVTGLLLIATGYFWPRPLTGGEQADRDAHHDVEIFHDRIADAPKVPLTTTTPPSTTGTVVPPTVDVFKLIHGDTIGVLSIPKIGIEYPIREGTDLPLLRAAVGHYEKTQGPGEVGNFGTAAHSCCGEKSAPYMRLKELRPGDEVIVETLHARYVYHVIPTPPACGSETPLVVDEHRADVLNSEPCSAKPGTRRLATLTTCEPVQSAHKPFRLIVWAELDHSE